MRCAGLKTAMETIWVPVLSIFHFQRSGSKTLPTLVEGEKHVFTSSLFFFLNSCRTLQAQKRGVWREGVDNAARPLMKRKISRHLAEHGKREGELGAGGNSCGNH